MTDRLQSVIEKLSEVASRLGSEAMEATLSAMFLEGVGYVTLFFIVTGIYSFVNYKAM